MIPGFIRLLTHTLRVPQADREWVGPLVEFLTVWVRRAAIGLLIILIFYAIARYYGTPWGAVIGTILFTAALFGLRKLLQEEKLDETINLFLFLVLLYPSLVLPLSPRMAGWIALACALPVAAAAFLLTPGAAWVWAGVAALALLVRSVVAALLSNTGVDWIALVGSVALLNLLACFEWLASGAVRRALSRLRREIEQGRTGVEIGHMVTSALDTALIIQQAVQMIQRTFGYYHVGLYTLDREREVAVLADAAGHEADELKAKHFTSSLTSPTVLALAVNQGKRQRLFSWEKLSDPYGRRVEFTHPRFLTRAELAIPLQVGERVLGVLDVHALELDAFSEGDIHVLEGLAGNIANALNVAHLLQERQQAAEALEKAYADVEKQVRERTAELMREIAERERLQQEIIEAQRRAIRELTVPIIPVMERIIVMPLIGTIDNVRARDIMRRLLVGIREHRAKVVIMDVTGVPFIDTGVAEYLNKAIQAARLRGAATILTGIPNAVAEAMVEMGIDWSEIETSRDLQTGLRAALEKMGRRISEM
ncbi:MAG: GAF domain-containing protein [Anaerolineae bacterium]|nr:GAF domain-containing protein [Anaerolineae bacterium]